MTLTAQTIAKSDQWRFIDSKNLSREQPFIIMVLDLLPNYEGAQHKWKAKDHTF